MKKSNDELVKVIFRRWGKNDGGGALALFPELDEGSHLCSSFEHVGQHSGADYHGCINRTKSAGMDEPDVAALYRELTSYPYEYKLRVVKRISRSAVCSKR